MARKPRFDLVTPALIAAMVALLGVWWWSLGGRSPDLAMAPARSTLSPPARPKPAPPREPPPEAGVAERLPPDLDAMVAAVMEPMEHPVRCATAKAEAEIVGGGVHRAGELVGVVVVVGDQAIFDFGEGLPEPGRVSVYTQDNRTFSVDLVGDPLRCDPDPIVLPDATNVAEVTLLVRNGGAPGQTVVRGCGAAGSPDPQGRLTLRVLADHLDEGCTLSVTRRDGVLDVPGAEIELGPEDADGEVTVDLPEARTGGLGTSLELQGDAIVLLEIFPGTPAAAAGLQPGDRLLSADGQALPADLDAARSLLTGAEGSEVELEIENDDGVRIVRIRRAFLQ